MKFSQPGGGSPSSGAAPTAGHFARLVKGGPRTDRSQVLRMRRWLVSLGTTYGVKDLEVGTASTGSLQPHAGEAVIVLGAARMDRHIVQATPALS